MKKQLIYDLKRLQALQKRIEESKSLRLKADERDALSSFLQFAIDDCYDVENDN